mgnify:CR=1 FL=1
MTLEELLESLRCEEYQQRADRESLYELQESIERGERGIILAKIDIAVLAGVNHPKAQLNAEQVYLLKSTILPTLDGIEKRTAEYIIGALE